MDIHGLSMGIHRPSMMDLQGFLLFGLGWGGLCRLMLPTPLPTSAHTWHLSYPRWKCRVHAVLTSQLTIRGLEIGLAFHFARKKCAWEVLASTICCGNVGGQQSVLETWFDSNNELRNFGGCRKCMDPRSYLGVAPGLKTCFLVSVLGLGGASYVGSAAKVTLHLPSRSRF